MDGTPNTQAITGISHSGFYVENLDRTIDFYTKVLGARLAWRKDDAKNPLIKMYIGDFGLSIITRPPEVPKTEIPHAVHWAFAVNPATAEQHIEYVKSCGIEVEGPIRNPAERHIVSWFFVDPDGHRLEVEARYPAAEMAAEVIERGKTNVRHDLGLYGADENKRKMF